MLIPLLLSCAYTLRVDSRPSPAIFQMDDGRRFTTPSEVRVKWRPFSKETALVTATGYRPYTLEMGRVRGFRMLLGFSVRVEVLLVPAHGATGTWTVEDVP